MRTGRAFTSPARCWRSRWRCCDSRELKKWRDSLLGTMAPSTINRLGRCLCAALEQAAQHDKRIQNRDAWEVGLALLPNAFVSRNIVLPDDTVRAFVATAYGLDHQFGLLSERWPQPARDHRKPCGCGSRICTTIRYAPS